MLKPSLTGWQDQYDRLKRSYDRVTGSYTSSVVHSDDLHCFMEFCWHLKDWIKNDPATAKGRNIEMSVKNYESLLVCADLANGSEHLTTDPKRKPRLGANVTSTNVSVPLGQDRPICVEYVVTLSDGRSMSADDVVRQAFEDWNALIEKLGLLP